MTEIALAEAPGALGRMSDEELQRTILRLAAEGAMRATDNSGEFANEAEVHYYVADRLRDHLVVTPEISRSKYTEWFHKPDYAGNFSIDLVIWDRGATHKEATARAIVELKLTADPNVLRRDIERTRRFIHGKFDHPVLGFVVACASYGDHGKVAREIKDAEALAGELGCPIMVHEFDRAVGNWHHHGVVIGLTVQ
jgi:hypothetical protein